MTALTQADDDVDAFSANALFRGFIKGERLGDSGTL
jgi:hypothetical protein